MRYASWIFEENLAALLRLLARQAGHDFHPDEIAGILHGTRMTNSTGQFYRTALVGDRHIAVGLSRDSEGGIIAYEVECDEDLWMRLELAAGLMAEYILHGGGNT